MLPSMPFLILSSQDNIIKDLPRSFEHKGTEADATSKKTNKIEPSQRNGGCSNIEADYNLPFESLPVDDKECDDELVLLANSSSPHHEKRKLFLQNHSSKKRRRLDTTAGVGATEDLGNQVDKAHHFAEAYFTKVKSTLDDPSFQKFIATLSCFNEEAGNVIELYNQMMDLLKNHLELSEEFVGFLLPHQSLECNLFMDYMYFDKAWKFFRKADACHLNKVMHVFEQHASNTSSLDQLRNSILPLLKGQPLLVEAFLELLPNEKPPQSSLMDFEDITGNTGTEGDWERLRVHSHPDRGCGNSCSCKCHTLQHLCTSCNLKFINGQIFIQYDKLTRFARLHFNGSNVEEELRRLHPVAYTKPGKKKKTVKSQKGSVNLAPEVTKDNRTGSTGPMNEEAVDELHIKLEEFSDYDMIEANDDDVIEINDDEVIEDEDENEEYCFEDDKMSETSSGEGDKSLDSINGDLIEFDEAKENVKVEPVNSSLSSVDKLDVDVLKAEISGESSVKEDVPAVSGEAKSDESSLSSEESGEIVDESDSNESSDDNKESVQKPTEDCVSNSASWTREEDKVILEEFQKELVDTEHTFSKISCLMPSRSIHDIQGRFQVLMKLLEKVASESHENQPI